MQREKGMCCVDCIIFCTNWKNPVGDAILVVVEVSFLLDCWLRVPVLDNKN